jgi:ribose/xylose/arabinose/galactoside ABC-type transport system permease subunit
MTKKQLRAFAESKGFVLLVLLLIIVLFFTITSKGSFIGLINIRNIFNSMVVTALLTVGAVPLMIAGHIDLSSGNAGSVCGVLMAVLLSSGVHWVFSLLLALAAAAVIGLINAILVNRFGFQSFIATLAMASVLQGLTFLICNSSSIAIKYKTILYLGTGKIGNVLPVAIIFALLALIIYGVILSKTNFGKEIYIVGSNPHAALLTGLSPKKIYYALFINNAVLGGFAGCLLAARLKAGTVNGTGDGQFAGMTAAILGGVSFGGGSGGMGGAFIGLLILNSFNNGLKVLKLSSYWQSVASGVLLLIALAFDFMSIQRRGSATCGAIWYNIIRNGRQSRPAVPSPPALRAEPAIWYITLNFAMFPARFRVCRRLMRSASA